MNNTVTEKTKHFLRMFRRIKLKPKWHYFLSRSIITAKLDICSSKYKIDYICKSLLQAIFLAAINIWLNFLLEMKPCLHQILIPQPRPLCPCLVLAPISEKFLDTKMITDFRLSHYIELNRTSAKPRLFEVVKQNLGENTNETLLFLQVGVSKVRMVSYFISNFGKQEGDFWNVYQKLYITINWLSGNVWAGLFVAEHDGWKKWIKTHKKKGLITCIIRLFKIYILEGLSCFSWVEIFEGIWIRNHFQGHQYFGTHVAGAFWKQHWVSLLVQKHISISYSHRQLHSNL